MRIPRRTFVNTGLTTAAAIATVGCGGVMRLAAETVDGAVVIPREEVATLWTERAAVVIALGGDGGSIVLSPLGTDGVTAVTATCTHLGCEVRPSGEFLVCPCHGSTFATDGRVLRGPAPRALNVHPVAVTEDSVTIQLTHARTVQ